MNTTAKEVRHSIEEIAKAGLKSKKIQERHFWLQIPKKDELPTAEEIVAFLSLMAIHDKKGDEMQTE